MAAATRIGRKEAARRYLQADMDRSYTGLPDEAKEIHEETQRRLVNEHGDDLPLLATVGTDRDFDAPLTSGEREHQRYMRTQLPDGSPQAVAEHRARLRGKPAPAPRRSPPRRRPAPRVSSARRTAGAGVGAVQSAVGGRGSVFLQLVGWTLALSLLYLLVAGKGVNALKGITNAVVGGVTTFIKPVDPIASLETALGATPPSAASSSSSPTNPALAGVTGSTLPASSVAPGNSAGTGTDAPTPAAAAAGAKAKVSAWGLPASLLQADLSLRRTAAAAVKAGSETVTQARTAEERLIPRKKYPAFYANQG